MAIRVKEKAEDREEKDTKGYKAALLMSFKEGFEISNKSLTGENEILVGYKCSISECDWTYPAEEFAIAIREYYNHVREIHKSLGDTHLLRRYKIK